MFCFLTDPRVASCKESENREGKNRRQNQKTGDKTEETEDKTKREKKRKGMYRIIIIILQSGFR